LLLEVLAVEVEWVDVLVLLGGILRVLDGAVRADEEPVRVLLYVWVVGRDLDRVIEGDLDALITRGGDQPAEVGERSQLRVNCLVSAGLGADRVRRARLSRLCHESVVLSLAVRESDRVNRREVEHVEAELPDVG